MEKQFERTAKLIGEENVDMLSKKHVAIFGLGGVGGFVADSLARCGVGEFTLIDNDVVSETNINRQIVAYHSTIGMLKTEVLAKHLLDINPNLKINILNMFVLEDNINEINFNVFNYVVDAVDTVSAKLAIISKCKNFGIDIISSMGTGNKLNPHLLKICDIFKTSYDPLAKVVRKKLRENNINHLKVLSSDEKILKVVVESEQNNRHSPASISFIPACAGEMIACEVINDLIKNI